MNRDGPAVLSGLAGLLAFYLTVPFLVGAWQVGRADWVSVDIIALEQACVVSLSSASIATAVIGLCGVPLGYVLARQAGRGLSALGFVVQLPLALPPLASGILLLFVFGGASPLGQLLGGVTDTFIGIVLAEIFVAAPFLIVAARSGFANVDPMLEEVAATMGHAALARFLRVSLPLAWPAIRAGLLLAWLRGFGEFGATVMVAYHPYSLPVYTYVAFGAQGLPAMLPVLLPTLFMAAAVMALSTLRVGPGPRAPSADLPPLPAVGRPVALDVAAPLAFRFRKRLGAFSLEVDWAPNGRRLAILGPSGSGKSLTLRLIAGLEWADSGALHLDMRELSTATPETRGIAYMPQTYALLPHCTVMQQLLFPVGARRAEAVSWIAALGLAGYEDRLPGELSLGQQQRVALARAMLQKAALILLDEPFTALDTPLRLRLRRELREVQGLASATTLLVTHDPDEALLLADELLILDHGRVLQHGPVEDLLARPVNEQVARLLGAEPASAGTALGGGRIDIGGAALQMCGQDWRPGQPVMWTVRRGFARLEQNGTYCGIAEDVVPAVAGYEVTVRLRSARLRVIAATAACPERGPCRLDIDPAGVLAWPV